MPLLPASPALPSTPVDLDDECVVDDLRAKAGSVCQRLIDEAAGDGWALAYTLVERCGVDLRELANLPIPSFVKSDADAVKGEI